MMNHITEASRVALVHDWLDTSAGAEKVLAELASIYPQAPIYVLIANPELIKTTPWLAKRNIHCSFIQRLPGSPKRFRAYLPLMPIAIEQFDLSAYDLIVSSSHAVAKGIIVGPNQHHICYMHSPMRYAWDMQHGVLRASGMSWGIRSLFARWVLHYLRLWDATTAQRIDTLVVNSHFVARRSRRVYGRSGKVLHPPVDTEFFSPSTIPLQRSGFVTASRLVPYKRIDSIVRAFARLPDEQLIVVGDGPERERLEAMASPNVRFMGRLSDHELRHQLRLADAFIFAAEEDFGILPVEAMATGCPVIAFGKGGVRDTVVAEGEGATGLFFHAQTPEAVSQAVSEFKQRQFSEAHCVARAQHFSRQAFHMGWQRLALLSSEHDSD